ncbi:transcription factor HES-5-like [Chanos chanos]|uniref:Transcription factor HES-5 n=1 Tax=Chanos chanos TaxID=29144 RepID=A0A6J2VL48_CHACN|nr:transcription factor HES-5-like [Chanos chanos]
MQPVQVRLTPHRDLHHRHTSMAPAITTRMTNPNEHKSPTNKLRKPIIEKMRRDRINTSIEQLKSLLSAEFLNQQPDSKLEKADILEITVCFLRQKQQQQQKMQQMSANISSTAVHQGFSRCVQEIVHFLSKNEMKTQSQRRLLNHFQNFQPSSDSYKRENVFSQPNSPDNHTINKEKSLAKRVLWRPW